MYTTSTANRFLASFLVAFLILFVYLSAPAKKVKEFRFPNTVYDPSIPSPSSYLGYKLGTHFTRHYEVVQYLKLLADKSDRILYREYGKTYEGRKLVYLVISSENNIKRIDAIRRNNLTLVDPSKNISQDYYKGAPVIVWFSYNIHGNEASCTETAIALAYHLVSDESDRTKELLREVVVIIDPALNPDGRERYVNFYYSQIGTEPDFIRYSREHREPWPTGRFNHYLFDLNRDWTWLIQAESKQRVRAYLSWFPQVHVDFHEMYSGSSYFFFPAKQPLNPNYPENVEEWAAVFGKANALAFDEHGWSYFTEEEFDMFYPGYGDSWPSFHGATGMTYEQAGHGLSGLGVERKDKTVLTLADRMSHHFLSSITTLDTAKELRIKRLKSFRNFFMEGVKGAANEKIKGYIIPTGNDKVRTSDLMALLMDHGVEVDEAISQIEASKVYDLEGKERLGKKKFDKGTYIIPLAQPLRRFAKTLLQPVIAIPDTFFYDITAWSLPYAYGVRAFSFRGSIKGGLRKLSSRPLPRGNLIGEEATYGYLLPWTSNGTPKILSELLRSGCHVRFATEGFTLDGREFDAGTLILPAVNNSDTLGVLLKRLAEEADVDVCKAKTSLTEKGIDLGSNKTRYIKPIKVAILSGRGTNPTSFGALWFLLDRIYQVEHSVIDLLDLESTDLRKFDVMVLPDDWKGGGAAYKEVLDSTMAERIRGWIKTGGVFVALGGGAVYATKDYSGISSIKMKKKEEEKKEKENEKGKKKTTTFLTLKEKEKKKEREMIPGTIFDVKLDGSHPIAFGYGSQVKIMKSTKVAFQPDEKINTVAFFPEKPKVAGFISKENEEFLAITPFIVEEKVGKGHVVLYLDDPNFRLFWYGLNRLFLNSIFFMPNY